MQAISLLVSMTILAVLFAAMFKFLPDANVAWRSVWLGGAVTAFLFEIGKFVIGLYLGKSNPGNPFGAASALAVIFVWVYYAGILVLFGAEFTQHYAQAHGEAFGPKSGAVRIEREERIVRDNAAPAASSSRRNDAVGSTDRSKPTSRGGISIRDEPAGASMPRAEIGPIPSIGEEEGSARRALHDASLGELFKQLSGDSTHLLQQEIQLAKTELQETASRAAGASRKLGIAAGLALPGILAITAALIIVLGILIHSYWGSALILGAVILLVAAVLLKRAIDELKAGLAPKQTVRTVRDDIDWAKRETTRMKQEP